MEKQKVKLLFALNSFNRAAVSGPPEPPAGQTRESSKTLLICLEFSFHPYNTSVHSSFNLKRCFPTLMQQEIHASSVSARSGSGGGGGSRGETTALIKRGGHRGTHGSIFLHAS